MAEKIAFKIAGNVPKANCGNCHDWLKTKGTVRRLGRPHQTHTMAHGSAPLWCFDCHDKEEPGRLKLARGESAPFSELYRSCQICHAQTVKRWRHGIHGKRMQRWQGEKIYARCSLCHDPHAPKWPLKTAHPPPLKANTLVDKP